MTGVIKCKLIPVTATPKQKYEIINKLTINIME